MSSRPRFRAARVSYSDAVSERELCALAAIYRRAVERYQEANSRKKGGCGTAPDARKEINGSGKTIISK